MSRRVRRDSETSTDSWSLVEEEDDFSFNCTEDEGMELEQEQEPIVEEPPSSDEELTASECSDEESDLSDEESEDGEEEEEEVEEAEEEADQIEESDEDSDLSDAESEKSEISDEEEEIGIMSEEQEIQAAIRCKEDEEWMDEELDGDYSVDNVRRVCRVMLFITLFIMLFPLADVFTSWMLTYRTHQFVQKPNVIFEHYSQQSYNPGKKSFGSLREKLRLKEEQEKGPYRFIPITNKKRSAPVQIQWHNELIKAEEYHTRKIRNFREYKFMAEAEKSNSTIILPSPTLSFSNISIFSTISENYPEFLPIQKKMCRALAPIPPAPFSPRRHYRNPSPRHQPCLIHVNESKWVCRKEKFEENHRMLPMKIASKSLSKKSWTFEHNFKKFEQVKEQKLDICAKKASQSMRTVSKPTDQCHSRNISKFVPRRKHISFKTPLPCKAPTYKPTQPKPTRKPSEDWLSKRSNLRAQLRSRA